MLNNQCCKPKGFARLGLCLDLLRILPHIDLLIQFDVYEASYWIDSISKRTAIVKTRKERAARVAAYMLPIDELVC